jgi:predicted short-subunit dehydrogenase-like oxidoreductase (DUF2520 family)
MDVTIVGLGNWGSSLAHACHAAGIPLKEVVVRSRRRLPSLPIVQFEQARFDAQVLWLCVRDGEIATVAQHIAARRGRLHGQTVIHSSGALNVTALDAVNRAGAHVASLAPVMTFPTRVPVPIAGVLFAMEAKARVKKRLNALVHALGGRTFPIESHNKVLYHAAATLASPLLVSELSAAMAAARLAGLSSTQAKEWLGALGQATFRNVLTQGAENSFSGPFARGDAATIRLHLQALAEHPILAEVYRSLGRHAVEALPGKRKKDLEALLKPLQEEKPSGVRH